MEDSEEEVPQEVLKRYEKTAARRARERVRRGGNKGVAFLGAKNQPVIEAMNKALEAERRRKVN
jgi:hypothetical protein